MREYDYEFVQAVRRQFAEMGLIAIIWDFEDVQTVAPELTEKQALEVLQKIEEDHNANYGVNWDTLRDVAHQMFPEVLKWSQRD